MLNILCTHCTQGKLYWGSHLSTPHPLTSFRSCQFYLLGSDMITWSQYTFIFSSCTKANQILNWFFWVKPDDEYSDFESTRCCNSKLETVHFKSFFCFPFFYRHELSGLKLTKLNLKLYYLPKDIKFADEKLNFQQLVGPVLPTKKLFKSSFIRWFR